MIIDCHGHYTTAPGELQKYRDAQIAGLNAPLPDDFVAFLAQNSPGDDRKIDTLREVMRDAVETVDPGRAHWAWLCLFFAVHKVIENDRPIRSGE